MAKRFDLLEDGSIAAFVQEAGKTKDGKRKVRIRIKSAGWQTHATLSYIQSVELQFESAEKKAARRSR